MAKERTVTIELDYPVQLPDGELKRLVMHRPSVKEVMDNPIRDALDIAGESRLYAVLCGIGGIVFAFYNERKVLNRLDG